jgi:hypothetical protein
MGVLRLYRDIYRVNINTLTGDTYTLIDPISITSSSYIRNSSNVIESPTPIMESTGIYYAELNPTFYTFSDIYELRWSVVYITGAPTKILTTRFRMKPMNVTGGVTVDVIDNELVLETGHNQIIIEIGNAT